jgi:hypothetical protein
MIDINQWLAGVRSDHRLGPRTKLIAAALAKYFHDGKATVAIEVLSGETGCIAAVFGLRALRRYGWLISSDAGDQHYPLMSASGDRAAMGFGRG